MNRWLTAVSLVIASLVLAVAGGCGSDEAGEVSPHEDSGSETVYAGVTIYTQEVEYKGVVYNCFLAGYSNYPGLWCERADEGTEEIEDPLDFDG